MKPFLFFVLFLGLGTHQENHFNVKSGLGLSGYDPVAYFTQHQAVEGRSSLKAEHENVVYYFASSENQNLFQNNPGMYTPQYGGWCAYAMGKSGEQVKIDPETFKIVEDKLYLFYNFWGTNTLESWNEDEPHLKSSADDFWQNIIASK